MSDSEGSGKISSTRVRNLKKPTQDVLEITVLDTQTRLKVKAMVRVNGTPRCMILNENLFQLVTFDANKVAASKCWEDIEKACDAEMPNGTILALAYFLSTCQTLLYHQVEIDVEYLRMTLVDGMHWSEPSRQNSENSDEESLKLSENSED